MAAAEDDPWGGPVNLDDRDDEAGFWAGVRAEAGRHRPPLPGSGGRREWFLEERRKANVVACRDCKRAVGDTCVVAGTCPPQELTRFPAHTRRTLDAEAKAADR